MVLLPTPEAFLHELHDMYAGPAGVAGTVFVTMKPHVPAANRCGGSSQQAGQHGDKHSRHHGHGSGAVIKPGEPCTLVRAVCGRRKISTMVCPVVVSVCLCRACGCPCCVCVFASSM